MTVPQEPTERYAVPHKYVYVLVRADLSLRQQIVQSVHAALEAGFTFRDARVEGDEHWLVMCSVDDRNALVAANEQIRADGIETYVFYEPDDDLGFTALATEPIAKAQRKRLRRYKLWSE